MSELKCPVCGGSITHTTLTGKRCECETAWLNYGDIAKAWQSRALTTEAESYHRLKSLEIYSKEKIDLTHEVNKAESELEKVTAELAEIKKRIGAVTAESIKRILISNYGTIDARSVAIFALIRPDEKGGVS
jgi:hypothetical protein